LVAASRAVLLKGAVNLNKGTMPGSNGGSSAGA
jgi:hypothetical protein